MEVLSSENVVHLQEEPTEDWTVEQLLQWCLQRSQSSVNSKTNELVNALQGLQDDAECDIWELHKLAVQQNFESDKGETVGAENIEPAINVDKLNSKFDGSNTDHADKAAVSSTTSASSSKTKTKKKQLHNLFVSVRSGPHEGATFLLKPRQSRPCEIGRSKGKKFLQRGISLSKDSEVSTCHGKFEYKAGKMYYTDTGSTNGSSYMGEAIPDNVPMELTDGMVLVFGESELEFTIVEN